MYLDGEKVGMIDAWVPERTTDNDYWHAHGLAPGRHEVRIVMRDDADERSEGRLIRLEAWIAYDDRLR